jgi:hypothetical protein
MGSNVSFFAFDQQPDVRALNAITWLSAFRFFRRKGSSEWYLEGPCAAGDDITFFERLVTDHSKLATLGAVTATVEKLQAEMKSLTKYVPHYDDEGLLHALALSMALQQRVLYISGNDEGIDCGFVCKEGAIVNGRLGVDSSNALVIDDGGVRVESLHPDSANADTSEPRAMYALASQKAAAFFGSGTPWPISSYDIKPEEYELIGRKGAPEPSPHGLHAEFEAVYASSITSAEKLTRYLAIIAPHIDAALRTNLIFAERQNRDPIEQQLLKCWTFAASSVSDRPPQMKALADLLSELLGYMRVLRPRPRFRQKLDFHALNRQLTRRWWVLRTKIAIRAMIGFP